MVVICIVGRPYSGKRTLAAILEEEQNCSIINIEEWFELNVLSKWGTHENDSPDKQLERSFLRQHCFAELEKFLLRQNRQKFVLLSVSNPSELIRLSKSSSVITLALHAPLLVRYQRCQAKQSISLEEFVNQEADKDVQDSTRLFASNIEECLFLCDYHIRNTSTVENLKVQLREHFLYTLNFCVKSTFDDYFMALAFLTAARTNCLRRSVGAVLTKENRVVATGYNGTPSGFPNCYEGGCDRCADGTVTTGQALEECLCVHAEANALLQAGLSTSENGTLYVTSFPCLSCAKLILQGKIKRLVYSEAYGNHSLSLKLFERMAIQLDHLKPKGQNRLLGPLRRHASTC